MTHDDLHARGFHETVIEIDEGMPPRPSPELAADYTRAVVRQMDRMGAFRAYRQPMMTLRREGTGMVAGINEYAAYTPAEWKGIPAPPGPRDVWVIWAENIGIVDWAIPIPDGTQPLDCFLLENILTEDAPQRPN